MGLDVSFFAEAKVDREFLSKLDGFLKAHNSSFESVTLTKKGQKVFPGESFEAGDVEEIISLLESEEHEEARIGFNKTKLENFPVSISFNKSMCSFNFLEPYRNHDPGRMIDACIDLCKALGILRGFIGHDSIELDTFKGMDYFIEKFGRDCREAIALVLSKSAYPGVHATFVNKLEKEGFIVLTTIEYAETKGKMQD